MNNLDKQFLSDLSKNGSHYDSVENNYYRFSFKLFKQSFFNKRVQLKNLQNLLQRVFFYLKKNVNSVTLAICT